MTIDWLSYEGAGGDAVGTEHGKAMLGRGYRDPTAWIALNNIEKEERQKVKKEAAALVTEVKELLRSRGFELAGRLQIIHRASGSKFE